MTVPPLLALAQGRRVRPRKPKAIPPKEIKLQIAVADLLRRFARPDWRWTHFPAGELRDIRTAAKLKAMGLRPGWPDFILVDPSGKFHALELKREGETLSEDQESFRDWCVAQGIPHTVNCSLEETIKVLACRGVLRITIGARK